MKEYIVTTREVVYKSYFVDAESEEEEAMEIVDGDDFDLSKYNDVDYEDFEVRDACEVSEW